MNTALLVVHDIGDPEAGAGWRDLLEAWPGPSLAPDLPGHGRTPPPTGAAYALPDAAIYAWRAAEDAGIVGPEDVDVVVLGHASGGFAAEILAAGGRASRLILVDGLGPPWMTVDEIVAGQQRFMRELFSDADALGPPAKVPDPRLAHDFPPIWERGFIRNLRRSITVPVLVIESSYSPTPSSELVDRRADYSGSTELMYIAGDVAGAVTSCLRHVGWLG